MNRSTVFFWFLFFFLLCHNQAIKSQISDSLTHTPEVDFSNMTPDDYVQIKLPDLSLLFENAKGSATVKYYDARKESEKSMLKTVKNQWLKYFKIVAAYQYGVMGTTATLSEQNQGTPINQLSNSKQNWYNVGMAISVPLDELFDRGNKVRRQRMEMKATEAEVERWHDEQKIRIIEAYTKAQFYISVVKAKGESMIIAGAQYKIAESDFINGKIKPSDLSARKSVHTDAVVNYEQAKHELVMVILQLEVLSKTKIISR